MGTVIDSTFTWGDDRPPRTPWNKTVIYEMHVRGFTMRHPRVPELLRGTYEALTTDEALDHLVSLGITAVELMPVHHFLNDQHLVERGLSNYWGYNTFCYFAPEIRYAAAGHIGDATVREFKRMVRALHSAGLEVILDVVYNHTAEGNHLGPTISLRGIDNAAYYRLVHDNPRFYLDFTGTGNTLNMRSPRVLQLIMDSLRYWVLEMHVDGFRFDLASTLARELYEVDRLGAFLDIIHQDPVISQVKLIAEPWDLGEGGYQVGNFPVLWTEWNGKYRDSVRRFWRGDDGVVSEFATRLAGSNDLYEHERTPAVCEHQLRHGARRVHDARSRQLQREAQRSQRRREPRRREPQSELELRRGGSDDRQGDSRASRAAEAQPDGNPAALGRRADAERRRRDVPHATRQQQRLLPGQRHQLDQLGARAGRRGLPRFHASSRSICASRSRSSSVAGSSRAGRSAASRTSCGSIRPATR